MSPVGDRQSSWSCASGTGGPGGPAGLGGGTSCSSSSPETLASSTWDIVPPSGGGTSVPYWTRTTLAPIRKTDLRLDAVPTFPGGPRPSSDGSLQRETKALRDVPPAGPTGARMCRAGAEPNHSPSTSRSRLTLGKEFEHRKRDRKADRIVQGAYVGNVAASDPVPRRGPALRGPRGEPNVRRHCTHAYSNLGSNRHASHPAHEYFTPPRPAAPLRG